MKIALAEATRLGQYKELIENDDAEDIFIQLGLGVEVDLELIEGCIYEEDNAIARRVVSAGVEILFYFRKMKMIFAIANLADSYIVCEKAINNHQLLMKF